MAVFPPASATLLPPSWAQLMTDPASDIVHFYPQSFMTDLNGERHDWQGIWYF